VGGFRYFYDRVAENRERQAKMNEASGSPPSQPGVVLMIDRGAATADVATMFSWLYEAGLDNPELVFTWSSPSVLPESPPSPHLVEIDRWLLEASEATSVVGRPDGPPAHEQVFASCPAGFERVRRAPATQKEVLWIDEVVKAMERCDCSGDVQGILWFDAVKYRETPPLRVAPIRRSVEEGVQWTEAGSTWDEASGDLLPNLRHAMEGNSSEPLILRVDKAPWR